MTLPAFFMFLSVMLIVVAAVVSVVIAAVVTIVVVIAVGGHQKCKRVRLHNHQSMDDFI